MANPTDLVKVRLQAEGKLPAGVPRRYSGAKDAYFTIVRQVSFLKVEQRASLPLLSLNIVSLLAYLFILCLSKIRKV